LANKATGRRRADVEINILEQFEFRSRRTIREAERARLKREARRAARAERKLSKLNPVQIKKPSIAKGAPLLEIAPGVTSRYLVRAERKTKFFSRRPVRNAVTMSVASGLFATFALPAYAYNPDIAAMARFTTTNAQEVASADDTQNLTVAAVNTVKFARGDYKSADADEIARQETLNAYRTYTGPTAEDYLANPPYSKIDGATVLQVAAKYVGTPYVFGGATPGGFDCSGYVAFVFAQFGVALPHSVHGQARLGIPIRAEDAVPGDLVIMNDMTHDGIYAGNGNFYHAPRRGDTVKLAPIYTSNVHFVRLATN
jgi:cell wall-associated NlpC family hydrolase